MKYIIFDLEGKKIGSYEGELDESSTNRSYLLCPPLAIHMELPEGMDEDCVKCEAVAEQVITPATPEKWIKDGSPDVFENPNDPEYTYIPAIEAVIQPAHMNIVLDNNLVSAKAAQAKTVQIQVLYDAMVKDVYDQMETVFGTRNDISAAAFASTWEAMKSRPANYVSTLGLTDESAVTTYANTKLTLADNYAKWRLTRITQFQADKAVILNS